MGPFGFVSFVLHGMDVLRRPAAFNIIKIVVVVCASRYLVFAPPFDAIVRERHVGARNLGGDVISETGFSRKPNTGDGFRRVTPTENPCNSVHQTAAELVLVVRLLAYGFPSSCLSKVTAFLQVLVTGSVLLELHLSFGTLFVGLLGFFGRICSVGYLSLLLAYVCGKV